MPPSSTRTTELTPETITLALLKGGLSLAESNMVIERIEFDKSTWDGTRVINTKID